MPKKLTRAEALDILGHSRTAQRRRGADRLRALADPSTAGSVLRALQAELRDVRTWETQVALVRALGATGNREHVPYLRDLALQPRDATAINWALGAAIVRLGREHEQDPAPVLWCLRQDVDNLDAGALQAVGDLRLRLTPEAVGDIIDHVRRAMGTVDPDEVVRSGHSARIEQLALRCIIAAAGWPDPAARAFLEERAGVEDHTYFGDPNRLAAERALTGAYPPEGEW